MPLHYPPSDDVSEFAVVPLRCVCLEAGNRRKVLRLVNAEKQATITWGEIYPELVIVLRWVVGKSSFGNLGIRK